MIIQNTQYYAGLDFEQYQALPGTSFSGLKDTPITPTSGMMLGTRVHQYLMEPEKYDWKQAEYVLPIARVVKSQIGDAFAYMESELSFTSDFIHNGMLFAYKGRADKIRAGRLLLDVKILAGDIEPAVKMFGYDNQLSGYCLATNTPMALIVAFNKSKRIVQTKVIRPDAAFWEYQCVHRGVPAA